jgi:voltage-gated potassium channel
MSNGPPNGRSAGLTRLRRFIHHPVTDLVVMLVILASVVGIVLEILLEPSHTRDVLSRVGDVFTCLFAVELTLRFVVAPSKARFFRTYWIDILAILPLMRAFRILRLLRLLRLFRFGVMLDRRVTRFTGLFRRGLEGYMVVLFAIITFVLVGALAMTILEGHTNTSFGSFEQSIWWAVLSLIAGEPIGGEASTGGGKVVQLLVMLGGVTIFAMFTGTFTALVIRVLGDRTEEINMEIDDLVGHVLLCGWKRGSAGLIAELQVDPAIRAAGIVVVSDQASEPDLIAAGATPDRVYFLRGDSTRVEVLRRAGVDRMGMAIIVPDKLTNLSDQDRDARSVLTALVIEKLNSEAFVVVELLNPDNETYLRMAGVEEVLVADRHTGRLLGVASRNRGLMATIRELLTSRYGNQFFKVPVPDSWAGRTIGDLFVEMKTRHNATIISLETPGPDHGVKVNPPPETSLQAGDKVVYVAGSWIDPKKL